jgi:type IV pilus assembly protein PilB
MKKVVPKQLGELLVEGRVITPENLEEALALQKKKGGLIGQILVGLGYASEQAIAQALTVQYGFPYLPLSDYEMDHEIARLIPEDAAQRLGLVAVDRIGSILTVATSNPLDTDSIREVEKMTRLDVQVFVSTQSDITEAIKRGYKT